MENQETIENMAAESDKEMTQSIKDSVNDSGSLNDREERAKDQYQELKVNTEEGSQEEVEKKHIQDINKEITREEMKHSFQEHLIPTEPSVSENDRKHD